MRPLFLVTLSVLLLAPLALAQPDGPAKVLRLESTALYSYAVPTAELENSSADDRLAFAAQLRAIFPRPARVPDLPTSLAAASRP